MERQSWIWPRKSPKKSPGGQPENTGGSANNSERYLDDKQEELKPSSNLSCTNHENSPAFSVNAVNTEVQETVKILTEKLSAAFVSITAKEDLVKQHAKVADEAVAGWEQAEAEVAILKQQLEDAVHKNSDLKDRISQLDEALKDCVRQLQQSREEQEAKRASESHSNVFELEKEILKLKKQLDDALSKTGTNKDQNNLEVKWKAVEKENIALKLELVAQYKVLEVLSLERELSNRAAETASKQHLESIKKVGMLEAECHSLRSLSGRFSPVTDHKTQSNSVWVELSSDGHSDSGERLLSVDTEPRSTDLWANALIAELDQLKNSVPTRNHATSVKIDFMDDFAEMEKLVAMPEADCSCSSFELEIDSKNDITRGSPSKIDHEVTNHKLIQLEEKVKKLENEKAELEGALVNVNSRLEASYSQVTASDSKLLELKAQLDQAVEMKLALENYVTVVEARRKELDSQLELALLEVGQLRETVLMLEQTIQCEKAQSAEFAARLEAKQAVILTHESQLESAQLEASSLRSSLGLLQSQLVQEKALISELVAKLDDIQVAKKSLETQLGDAHSKEKIFYEKISFLELKGEEEQTLSAEMESKVAAAEAEKNELASQLNFAQMEIKRLNSMNSELEEKIVREHALSTELAANCFKLEYELSKIKNESEVLRIASSKAEHRMKQENELAVAAEKLAQCQKTIASLGQQLKSLANLDELMLEDDQPKLNGRLPDLIGIETNDYNCIFSSEKTSNFSIPNGKEKTLSPPAILL